MYSMYTHSVAGDCLVAQGTNDMDVNLGPANNLEASWNSNTVCDKYLSSPKRVQPKSAVKKFKK